MGATYFRRPDLIEAQEFWRWSRQICKILEHTFSQGLDNTMSLEHLEFRSNYRHMPRNCAVLIKVMPLWVKCVVYAYASGDKDGTLQVAVLPRQRVQSEGVINVWILFSGSRGAPAFGTAATLVRDLTSVPRPWLTAICCMMPCAMRAWVTTGVCTRDLRCNADSA